MSNMRVLSGILFLFGMTIMGLSNLTTFFGITGADFPTTAGMGIFGLVLCLISALVMLDSNAQGQRGLYGAILFLAGLFHMSLAVVTIFFHATRVTDPVAVAAIVGGLVLALIGCALLPTRGWLRA